MIKQNEACSYFSAIKEFKTAFCINLIKAQTRRVTAHNAPVLSHKINIVFPLNFRQYIVQHFTV